MTTARDAILNKVGGTQTVLVYIATLDTGGISHSGRVFVAVDYSEANVQQALVAAVKADGWPEPVGRDPLPKTFDALMEYYGVRIEGPITVGTGRRTE